MPTLEEPHSVRTAGANQPLSSPGTHHHRLVLYLHTRWGWGRSLARAQEPPLFLGKEKARNPLAFSTLNGPCAHTPPAVLHAVSS